MRPAGASAAFVALALCAAPGAAAQGCWGSTARSGQAQAGVGFDAAPGARTYSMAVSLNPPTPLAAEVGARYTTLEESTIAPATLHARIEWELGALGLAVCPAVGFEYTMYEWHVGEGAGYVVDISYRKTAFPVGVSLGRRVELGSRMTLVPTLSGEWAWHRVASDFAYFQSESRGQTSGGAFLGTAGLALAWRDLVLRGQVAATTIPGSHPTVGAGVGILIP